MKQEQISFILDRFFYGWNMNIVMFDEKDRLCKMWQKGTGYDEAACVGIGTGQMPEYLGKLFSDIAGLCEGVDYPVIHMEQEGVYYMAFRDVERNLFVFGPASADVLSFSQQISFRKRHQITNQKYMVPKVTFSKALNGLSMVYYMMTGRQMTEDWIMKLNHVEEAADTAEAMIYEIKNSTEEKQHIAYQDEVRWTERIANGTMNDSEERLTPENIALLEQVGTLVNENSLKQYEYMVVTSTCLASRAAIRGGVNAYEAYMLSEVFLQRISKCTNVMELLYIHMEIANEFSRKVREAQEERRADCVEQCKDYIARHRTKKFSLAGVAEAVGRNPNYLSRIFSEQTGMTMQEYALDLRLDAAANILRYSNESIGDIAEYLSFPSQSYFGERFKKKYGMTPATFRKRNKIRDFKE